MQAFLGILKACSHPHDVQFLWPKQACYEGRQAKINAKHSFSSSFEHTSCINYGGGGGREKKRGILLVSSACWCSRKLRKTRITFDIHVEQLHFLTPIISTISVVSDKQKEWHHGSPHTSQTALRLKFCAWALPAPNAELYICLHPIHPMQSLDFNLLPRLYGLPINPTFLYSYIYNF